MSCRQPGWSPIARIPLFSLFWSTNEDKISYLTLEVIIGNENNSYLFGLPQSQR